MRSLQDEGAHDVVWCTMCFAFWRLAHKRTAQISRPNLKTLFTLPWCTMIFVSLCLAYRRRAQISRHAPYFHYIAVQRVLSVVFFFTLLLHWSECVLLLFQYALLADIVDFIVLLQVYRL